MAHRKSAKASFEAQGIKLTYTAYIVAACVAAMRTIPIINCRWHDDHVEIFGDYNIGVGTALGDKGLVVPVVHKAQELSLAGIASRLQDLTNRARNGKLTTADMRGGTFSISNHGVSGSLFASPIVINQPQAAILGVGKLEKRVVDGHQTNAWLSSFVETLETWPRHD